jgi:hypothetical protein
LPQPRAAKGLGTNTVQSTLSGWGNGGVASQGVASHGDNTHVSTHGNMGPKKSIGFEYEQIPYDQFNEKYNKRDLGSKGSPFTDRRNLNVSGKNMSFGAQASLSLGSHGNSTFRSKKLKDNNKLTSGYNSK